MSNLGNKEIMAKNIRRLMEQHNKDRNDICKDLGFKYTTFNDWYNGKTYPRIDKIEMMANYFSVSKADLVEESSHNVINSIPIEAGLKIPVLGRVAAGYDKQAIEEKIGEIEISPKMATQGDHFALLIKGDSMEPSIHENDTVIVNRDADVNSGDLVIALINGSDATCKRLQMYSDGIALIPNNPVYEPLRFTEQEMKEAPVRILGKVVELRRKF